ncbi:MAG: TonB-dependent receptor, partial [Pseudomonadota bacterium]
DWQPVQDHSFFVSSIFTEFTDDEVRDRYIFDFDTGTPNNCYAQVDSPCDNTPTSGTVYGARIDATFNTNNYRENIFTNSLGGDHAVSAWDIAWRLGYTHTVDELIAPARYNFLSPDDPTLRPTVAYNYTDADFPDSFLFETVAVGDGTFVAGAPIDVLSSDRFELNRIQFFDEVDRTQAYLARVDVERELNIFGNSTQFKAGLSYDQRNKKGDRNETIANQDSLSTAGLDVPAVDDLWTDRSWDGEFPNQFTVPIFGSSTAVELFNSLISQGGGFEAAGVRERNFFRIEENILAAYVSATVDYEWGNVIYGIRAEHSSYDGEALARIGAGPFLPVQSESDYLDFFPSVHVNYDLSDDRKLRVSFNSGIARPDFDEARVDQSLGNSTRGKSAVSSPRGCPVRGARHAPASGSPGQAWDATSPSQPSISHRACAFVGMNGAIHRAIQARYSQSGARDAAALSGSSLRRAQGAIRSTNTLAALAFLTRASAALRKRNSRIDTAGSSSSPH